MLFFINLHRPLAAKLGCGSLKSRAQRQVVSYGEKPDDVIVRFFCCFFAMNLFVFRTARKSHETQRVGEEKKELISVAVAACPRPPVTETHTKVKKLLLCVTHAAKQRRNPTILNLVILLLFSIFCSVCVPFFSLIQIYVNF